MVGPGDGTDGGCWWWVLVMVLMVGASGGCQ